MLKLLLIGSFADPPPGCLEYFPVDDEDDGQRHVKRGASGKDLIRDVLTDEATLLNIDPVQEFSVFPAK